jgi:peptide/nickel transport system substrate-binding protein
MMDKYLAHGVSILLILGLVSPMLIILPNHLAEAQFPRDETVFVTGAQWTPPSTWNPMAPSQTWGTYTYGGFLYLPLFQYVPGLNLWIPVIGESFEMPNEYVLRVKIRPEAKWSDGMPITAYDVEYTFNLSVKLGSGPAAGSELYVAGVKAKDSSTLEFYIRNDTKNYYMFTLYALQIAPVPKHIYEMVYQQIGDQIIEWRNCGGVCDDVVNLPQVVSGPYKLYYFDELRIVYIRLDNWWGKDIFGLPRPRYLVHRIYLSNEQALLDLMQGNVDWSGIFIPNVWELANYGVKTYYSGKPYFRPNQILVLYLNNQVEYLRDPVLKKAIAYAIEYDEVITKAWYGYTRQASMSFVFEIYEQYKIWINTTLAQQYWGTPDAKVVTNKNYARQLLDQAGYLDIDGDGYRETPTGQPLNISIMVPTGWTDWMIAADLIAGDLRDIGINAQSFPVDYGAYWGYIQGATYTALIGWLPAPTFSHPWDTYRYFLDSRLSPPTGNWEWYNNTEVSTLIEEASRALSFEERMRYFSQIQEIIYRDIPSIALAYAPQWYVYSTLYWVGWPSESNLWWTEVAPYREYSLALWTLFSLVPSGEQPTRPAWAAPVDQGGVLIPNDYLLAMLANATGQPFITTPIQTTTPTATTTFNTMTSPTTTEPIQTTTPPTGGGATNLLITLAVVAIAVVAFIIGVRYVVRRKT